MYCAVVLIRERREGTVLDELLERLREDAGRLEATIARYKSGSWKSGIIEDGRIIDTTAQDLGRLEGLLASMQELIAEWEDEIKAR